MNVKNLFANKSFDTFFTDNDANIPYPHDINYTHNSNGFRTDENLLQGQCLFLGCSITYGLGIPQQLRWTELVAKHHGLQAQNLSIPGASNDTIFRTALEWIPLLNPKHVYILSTYKERLEIFVDDNEQFLLPNMTTLPAWYKDIWLSSNNNSEYNYKKNILGIKSLFPDLIEINVKQIESSKLYADFGRDKLHPGIIAHSNIASEMLSV